MTYDIYLPTKKSGKKELLDTIRFEELGLSVWTARLLGRIKELYIVDDGLEGLWSWGLEDGGGLYQT